jgi:MurNAc alpha-1-phosphate uridylyltransferase
VHEDHSTRDQKLTFSGISVLHKKLFTGLSIEPLSVVPLLQAAMAENRVSGVIHPGLWMDIGTPERLLKVNALASAAAGE